MPGLSADALVPAKAADARHTFELLHTWLGEIIGETVGYALTATFTILVVRALASGWLAVLGYVSAALIATGVLIPLGLEVASLSNFAGYVAWCLWLIAMVVVLWRAAPLRRTASLYGQRG